MTFRLVAALIAVSFVSAMVTPLPGWANRSAPDLVFKGEPIQQFPRIKESCQKAGEKTDGMNKICYYRCLSGEAAITISSTQLCPLTIER
jgi:hypothetical protein